MQLLRLRANSAPEWPQIQHLAEIADERSPSLAPVSPSSQASSSRHHGTQRRWDISRYRTISYAARSSEPMTMTSRSFAIAPAARAMRRVFTGSAITASRRRRRRSSRRARRMAPADMIKSCPATHPRLLRERCSASGGHPQPVGSTVLAPATLSSHPCGPICHSPNQPQIRSYTRLEHSKPRWLVPLAVHWCDRGNASLRRESEWCPRALAIGTSPSPIH